MNDYGIGAFEALSWAQRILKKYGAKKGRKEIHNMIDRMVGGAAVNFKQQLQEMGDL